MTDAQSPELPVHPESKQAPPSILAVDDQPTIMRMFKVMVEHQGVFDIVETPQAAIEKFRARKGGYDVLLTDWNMPGMNGLELTRRIREEFPHVVVGLFTGGREGRSLPTAEELVSSGIVATLEKPFTIPDAEGAMEKITQALSPRQQPAQP